MLLHRTHRKYHEVSVHESMPQASSLDTLGRIQSQFFYLCCCCEIQAPLPLDRIGLILGMVVALEPPGCAATAPRSPKAGEAMCRKL